LSQWRVIAQLARTDGLSQTALARVIDTDQMTVGGLVARLEEKGLVARSPDPRDNRAKIVRLTAQAKTIIDEMRSVADEIFVEAFEGIKPSDRATMVSALIRLSANLSARI
jgi:MarR family transcriptional regulator for hemolysin